MRTRILLIPTVVAAGALSALPAGAAGEFGPGQYQVGPGGGDASTTSSADPVTGKVMIFQRNTRQAATVHCIGDGPRATLVASQPATPDVSTVSVAYEGATMSEHPVMDIAVKGSESGFLGHATEHGPKLNEAGTVEVTLFEAPQAGETLSVVFGLQVHAGCLPHPTMLGLMGSRPVEGGEATFTSVRIG